jgi:hypothetical protein
MILPFSTQLNGKPTYFVEKIHKGFRLMELIMKAGIDPSIHYPPNYNYVVKDKLSHKIHTIREDKKERWKPGTKIDFFINCRQKNMFRFAPVLPVVSVQKVQIMYKPESVFFARSYPADVYVDEIKLEVHEIPEFIKNDGFETAEAFFKYFNEDFTGKIIHWTDLKY